MGADGVLAGIRIVEIGAGATASLATRPLAEHGATVLRIESARQPGALRTAHAGAGESVDPDASPLFARLSPDKWSVAIDLARPRGAALVAQLVAWADVVAVHGDVTDMPALSPEALRAQHPALIVVTSSDPDAVVDAVAASRMALLVVAALLERSRTKSGRHIDMSDTACRIRLPERRVDEAQAAIHPCAGGGRIAIEFGRDEEWRALVDVMGAPRWAQDARFSTAAGRATHRDEIAAAVSAFTREHAPYPLMGRLQQAGVPAGVVQGLGQVLRDPQLAHRRHFAVLDHAVLGRMPYERSGFRLSASAGGFDDSAPLLGEDDDVVFAEILGLSPQEIEQLVADGAIGPRGALSTPRSS